MRDWKRGLRGEAGAELRARRAALARMLAASCGAVGCGRHRTYESPIVTLIGIAEARGGSKPCPPPNPNCP